MRWLCGNPEGRSEVSDQAKAMQPEDVTQMVAERLNAGDASGVAALYEPQAVLAYPRPAGHWTGGHPGDLPADGRRGGEVRDRDAAAHRQVRRPGADLDPLGRQPRRASPGAP